MVEADALVEVGMLRPLVRALVGLPLAALTLVAAPVDAQVTLAMDTLSEESPAAALCGFCGTEGYGAVFRELPAPARGLLAEDFPLTLRNVQLAIASARLNGSACETSAGGGTVLVDLEVWAGVTPPSGTIAASEPGTPWSDDEELVYAAVDVPVELSIPSDGTTGFSLTFNRYDVVDESGQPIVVDAGYSYLRVYVQLHPSTLPGPSCEFSSDGSPLRDEGRIADERGYVFVDGEGFRWNEDLGVGGDWAIRLGINPALPEVDASSAVDAALSFADAGAHDAGIDAGASPDASSGCGCRVAGVGASGLGAGPWLAGLALLAALVRRRRSR